jgi:hypothetical protein
MGPHHHPNGVCPYSAAPVEPAPDLPYQTPDNSASSASQDYDSSRTFRQ